MKKLAILLAVMVATAHLLAMPTRAELSKAQPLVVELMAPTLEEYKSATDKTVGAVKVGDNSCAFAAEAETEAVKFLLLKGAVNYYVRGEAYDKAADCIAKMKTDIKDLTPDAIADIVGKASGKITASKAPRLLAYYRAAKLQISARNEIPGLEQKLKRVKSDQLQRRYAEALAISGNWKDAYAAFAKSRNAPLAQLAEAEAKGAAANAQAAEIWWSYTPEFEGAENFFKIHAAEFYKKALEKGEISGLKKNIVERRIAQVSEDAVATDVAGAVPTPGSTSPGAAVRSLSAAAVAKSGKAIKVKIKNGVELEFLPCPAGSFVMGRATNPDDIAYRHDVTITRPFWMSKYPITVEQYAAFCPLDGEFKSQNGRQGEDKAPVCLCIAKVDDYCTWLNRRFASALPKKCVFRLPTDAEWEYALFANSKDTSDPYIRLRDGEKAAGQEIWGEANPFTPTAVDVTGKPNAWGLYNMLGNGCHYVLDTISSENVNNYHGFGGIKNLKCDYKESETDPLRWYIPSGNETTARHLMRGALYMGNPTGPSLYHRMVECGWVNRKTGPRMWTFRVVIGPDIVSEWMAKNGKK